MSVFISLSDWVVFMLVAHDAALILVPPPPTRAGPHRLNTEPRSRQVAGRHVMNGT